MKFSVLVPVYNVEKYLEDCLQSVIGQTYKDFEVILADDGSTDSSPAICDSYAEKYPFIKVFHKPNEGLMATRRFALSKASGQWIVNLDSDDWLTADALEKLSNAVDEYKPECIVYSIVKITSGKEEPFGTKYSDSPVLIENRQDFASIVLFNDQYNSLCRKAVLREKIGRDYSQYYGNSFGEDLLQSLEIYGNCERFLIIPDALYRYRTNEASITNENNPDKFYVNFSVLEKEIEFAEQNCSFDKAYYDSVRVRLAGDVGYGYVLRVARFRIPFERKVGYYTEIKNTGFYKTFLNSGNMEGLENRGMTRYFLLFRDNKYRTLSFLGWVSRMKRRMGL